MITLGFVCAAIICCIEILSALVHIVVVGQPMKGNYTAGAAIFQVCVSVVATIAVLGYFG